LALLGATAGLAVSTGFDGAAGVDITCCAGVAFSTFWVVFPGSFFTVAPVGSFFFGMNQSSESLDEFQGVALFLAGAATF
jgi:hypothetical protein